MKTVKGSYVVRSVADGRGSADREFVRRLDALRFAERLLARGHEILMLGPDTRPKPPLLTEGPPSGRSP